MKSQFVFLLIVLISAACSKRTECNLSEVRGYLSDGKEVGLFDSLKMQTIFYFYDPSCEECVAQIMLFQFSNQSSNYQTQMVVVSNSPSRVHTIPELILINSDYHDDLVRCFDVKTEPESILVNQKGEIIYRSKYLQDFM